MAHEIEIVGGRARMFAREGVPVWHGLGQRIQGSATAEQALALAGLDWLVEVRSLYSLQPVGESSDGACPFVPVPECREVVRLDDGKRLGIVGADYTPVQNRELCELLDGIRETGAQFETAGSLYGGRKVWFLARNPGQRSIGPDSIEDYVLVTTSHDGSAGVQVARTQTVVVCANTYRMALGRASDDAIRRIRHTAGVYAACRQALAQLRVLDEASQRHYELFGQFASERFTFSDFELLVGELASRGDERTKAGLLDRWHHGRGQDARGETRWRAFNSVTDFVDHCGRIGFALEANDLACERKMDSALFGAGQALKARALELLAQS